MKRTGRIDIKKIIKVIVVVYFIFCCIITYKETQDIKKAASETNQSVITVKIGDTSMKMYCTGMYLNTYGDLHLTYEKYHVLTGYTTYLDISFSLGGILEGRSYSVYGNQSVYDARFSVHVSTYPGRIISKISPFAVGKESCSYTVYNGEDGNMSLSVGDINRIEGIYSGIEIEGILIEENSGKKLRVVGTDITVVIESN